MNKPNNMKNRQRGRNNGKPRPMGGGGGRNPNFDGGQRMRGNAQQLMEKYLALARDASSSGDRVLAENYFQHADHYYRVLNARFEQQQNNGNRHQNYNQNGGHNNGQNYNQGGYNQGGFEGDQQPSFNEQQPQQGQYQQPSHHGQHQQPQQYQPQVQQPQPEPVYEQPRAPQGQSEDIGLPPGILGMNPQQSAPSPDNRQQGQARDDGGEGRGRRRRGRGDRGDRQGADAE